VLIALLAASALVRIAMFNGLLGSDDVLYLRRAVEVSQGIWSSSDYNGALRYGFNIPAGLAIHLFGLSPFAANLWSLLCSIVEVAVVYLFAASTWGRRAALYAALILAFMPLHIAVATRIHPDPVVSLFVTLSFVLFCLAERTGSRTLYFFTGTAMGMIFWAKELAVVTFLALALYPVVWRRLDTRWGYVIAGGVPLLVAHLALMMAVAGDPFHAFKVVTGQIRHGFIEAGLGEDSAWYYFRYLFFDIKHTWLAPWLASVAILAFGWRSWRSREGHEATAYVVFWLLSLLAVLSFMPVSLTPLRFVMKQSNYLSLFMAPIALLAGYQIARTPAQIARPLLAMVVMGGLALGLLEQQSVRVFTGNSKAAAEFARARPDAQFFGTVNNSNIARSYSLLTPDPALAKRFGELSEAPAAGAAPLDGKAADAFVVIDKETMGWGRKAIPITTIPSCWKEVQTLTPVGLGAGHVLIGYALSAAERLPGPLRNRVVPPIRRIFQPQPAVVYRVHLSRFWCSP
jgi:hypothetical protein